MTPTKPLLRTIAILAAALFAVGTPIVQQLMGVTDVGGTQLANEGDSTLEAAGYAFSIWGVIYAGLVLYALYQALPSTPESPGLRMLGWPSVVAMLGCGVWLVAATYDAKWATVAIILLSAIVLLVPLARRYPVQSVGDFWLIAAPVSLLAGWLTIASAINTLTVFTGLGLIPPESAPAWAAAGVVVVALVGISLSYTSKNWVYPLPLAWGLVAVTVAEQSDRPMIALLAAGAALAVAATALWVATHRARPADTLPSAMTQ